MSEYLTIHIFVFLSKIVLEHVVCVRVRARCVSRKKNRVLLTDTPGLPPIVETEFDYGDARWEKKKLTKV